MTIQKFIDIIQKKTGINEDTIGRLTYTHAIKTRMDQCGIEDMSAYLSTIENSPNEIDRLIEEIIIPETWFFREENAFEAMLADMNDNLQRDQTFPKRILSLPSSSGEEAYSIAIKLFENGYSSSMFSIDAIDISQRNIDMAKKGIYRPHAFRNNVPDHIIEKYFIENAGVYEISNRVKQAVNFTCANLFDYHTLSQEEYYDVVFCRNLFIYFDADTKNTAFRKINGSLKDKGLLLIGHAETSIIPNQHYQSCSTEHSFGFVKCPTRTDKNIARASLRTNILKPNINKKRTTTHPDKNNTTYTTTNINQQDTQLNETNHDYTTASTLADKGELDKALEITLSLCDKDKFADNYSLLGIIYNALSRTTEAEQAFRKALYLDPDHYEALIHLSLLLDKKGETHTSSLLKKRVVKTGTTGKLKEHSDD